MRYKGEAIVSWSLLFYISFTCTQLFLEWFCRSYVYWCEFRGHLLYYCVC